jgi:hypothetical protein
MDPEFETAITITPLEPLLAEASYLLMQSSAFDLLHSLLTELELPGLNKGSCEEFILMTLCLDTHDTGDFIHELLAET